MIVGILGPGGCGGTFLDWTLQYLSGQDKTLFVDCDLGLNRSNVVGQACHDLVLDPCRERTAHAHTKTHPNENSVDTVIDIFQKHTDFNLHTFYYVDSISQGRTQTEHNRLISKYPDIKFITYNFDEQDIDLIFCFQYEKIPIVNNLFEQTILSNSSVPLQQLPVWDKRELMSLYYPQTIRGQTTVEKILPVTNNHTIDFKNVFENLDTVIKNVFQYLNIDIHQDRWEDWKTIYNKWKSLNNLDFYQDINLIVQCILSNTPHDLSQYNMSFAKEIVIASKLLHNHNLALKAYGKSNLSQNTQQWTEILEPNTYHDLTKT